MTQVEYVTRLIECGAFSYFGGPIDREAAMDAMTDAVEADARAGISPGIKSAGPS